MNASRRLFRQLDEGLERVCLPHGIIGIFYFLFFSRLYSLDLLRRLNRFYLVYVDGGGERS
jgi:hypothetical protein